MTTNDASYWSTRDEMKFIAKLGSHGPSGKNFKTIELVEGYLQGAMTRQKWETVNKSKVINYARSMLHSLGKKK